MPKVFVVLDDREQMTVKKIWMDKDPEEALDFVVKVLAPKVRAKAPCFSAGGKLRLEKPE